MRHRQSLRELGASWADRAGHAPRQPPWNQRLAAVGQSLRAASVLSGRRRLLQRSGGARVVRVAWSAGPLRSCVFRSWTMAPPRRSAATMPR